MFGHLLNEENKFYYVCMPFEICYVKNGHFEHPSTAHYSIYDIFPWNNDKSNVSNENTCSIRCSKHFRWLPNKQKNAIWRARGSFSNFLENVQQRQFISIYNTEKRQIIFLHCRCLINFRRRQCENIMHFELLLCTLHSAQCTVLNLKSKYLHSHKSTRN